MADTEQPEQEPCYLEPPDFLFSSKKEKQAYRQRQKDGLIERSDSVQRPAKSDGYLELPFIICKWPDPKPARLFAVAEARKILNF